MKKTIVNSIIVCGVALLGLASCRKDSTISSVVVNGPAPTAAFTASIGALAVNFTNTTTNGESYLWQFGDGTSSTEKSPTHNYAVAAKYNVTLKATSSAGYSQTITKQIVAAAPATADFSIGSSFDRNIVFSNSSTAVETVAWDFGDGTTSASLTPDHKFPAFGNYTVKLTVTGLLGDVVSKTQTITVADNNLIKGGGFETGDNIYWTAWASQNNNPPTFGYTADKPSGGYDGSLRYPSFTNASGSTNQLIYQPVNVVAGKKYKMSARVKVPGGASQVYFQFYISTDPNTWVENSTASANHFLTINSWWGWGAQTNTVPLDGELVALAHKSYGFGAATNGVYTAPSTRTIYIGIQAGTYQGKSNGDWFLDNLSFVEIP